MSPEGVGPQARMPRWTQLLLLALFFASGATSLIYEVIWMRRITLVFGASQLAVATILAAFMAGLAGGAFLGGRWADRSKRLLLIYGVLELGIAGYALLFPELVDQLVGVYRLLVDAGEVEFWTSRVVHVLLMGVLLLPPTVAMGATLPLLVRLVSARISEVGSWTGVLYGVNTLGAVAGTLVVGFVLLPRLGVRQTEVAAAAANLSVGLLAVAWARAQPALLRGDLTDDRAERREAEELLELTEDPDLSPSRRALLLRVVPVVLLGSGFCAMVYEVAWSRLLGLILGSSVYAFTLMLVAFLLGTALGAPVGSVLLARRGSRPLRLLAVVLGLAAGTAWICHFGFGQLPYWYVDLYALSAGRDDLVFPIQSLIAIGVMTPTTFFIGMAFPLAMAILTRSPETVGRDVGRLYLFNTLGAVVGALCAGFVLLPLFGIQRTLELAVCFGLGLSAVVWALRDLRLRRRLAGLALLGGVGLAALFVRPTWDPLLLSAGMYKYVSDLSDYSHEAVRNYALSDFELLFYSEGTSSVVTVARSHSSDNVWLANNGKVDASSAEDLRTQLLLAHLPFLHRTEAQSALVVGLGSGITAGSVTIQDSLEQIDVLEIEPAVVVASHYFDAYNLRPLEDPRVRLIRNDARNHLVLHEGRYDVIINEPSNPWISGVSNLFTLEFLKLGRSRLEADGLFCQWVQTYGMSRDDLRSLLRTFAEVFPEVLLYQAPNDADILLVGSPASLRPFFANFGGWVTSERETDLQRIGASVAYDLLSYVRLDHEAILELAGDISLNTDDNVRIEFSSPLFLHYATSGPNEEMILQSAKPPWELSGLRPLEGSESSEIESYGEAFENQERWEEAEGAYRRALAFSPGNPRIEERLESLVWRREASEDED